ncbi:hypothetical protein [Marinobacter gelidimuriae]|nr:hypothetical protein [Marinobacter gelidimuriae]
MQEETALGMTKPAIAPTGGAPASRYFCDSLFWASEAKQAAKT